MSNLLRGNLIFLVLCFGVFLGARQAQANDGIPPEIFAMVQEGQDVVISIKVHDQAGEPNLDAGYLLERKGPEGDTAVLDGHVFDPSDATSSERYCRIQDWGAQEDLDCETDPSVCEDCDGDDVPECPVTNAYAYCSDAYWFEVIDECVPAGSTSYDLSAPDWSDWVFDSATIEVEDSGEPCDTGEEGSDCSVAGTPGAGGAAGLMMLVGLLGLVLSRRTWSR